MFFKSSNILYFFLFWNFSTMIAQPKIELLGSHQARPGFGAGLRIKIARNGVTGPLRFVSNIPNGCSINELSISSAVLSTSENILRAVWLTAPLRDTIVQEWEMKIPENAKGKYTLNGHLEYFEDGVMKTIPSNLIEIYLTPYFTRYLEN